MLHFARRYLKIRDTNNQSFVYHFVGNLLLYRKHQEALRLLQGFDMGFGRLNESFGV